MKDVYTLDDLRNWWTATTDARPPFRLAVLGDPVAHSASPPMHNAALAERGIAARYTRLHIRADELAEAFLMLPRQGFIGVNCTIPHKFAALELVDRVDDHARRIGVVNTVVVEGERLVGYNTDGPGLSRAVRAELGVELREMRVMILGAGGGAGRAVAMQCAYENCPRIVLLNRTVEKVGPLRRELGTFYPKEHLEIGRVEDTAIAAQLADSDLIINCTSLGMKPGDPSPIPGDLLNARHRLYDTIYTAARTPLLLAGDAVGARGANGLSMLLHQGALSFEIWFQREAPLEAMRAALWQHATAN
jgi:shikimate dehydrogenase